MRRVVGGVYSGEVRGGVVRWEEASFEVTY